jgi:Raf kinase inhibitor-like YbhB/YbcL family protein
MARRIVFLMLGFVFFMHCIETAYTKNKGGRTMTISVSSNAFTEAGMIPSKFTCDGKDVSPQLAWTGIPAGAKSIALICDDPDAPSGTWVHWVVYNMPATAKELSEGVTGSRGLPAGAKQGINDFRKHDYGGPCPPSGTHRYYFTVYALDTALNLKDGATKKELLKAMEGHVVAQGRLMGRYKRM